VWRGSALAEALLIGGLPAYDYVQQQRDTKETLDNFGEVRIAYALEACGEIGGVLSPKYFKSTAKGNYVPLFLDMEAVWQEVLTKLQINPIGCVPHLLWMDQWLANETLPPEAFSVTTPRQRARRLEDSSDIYGMEWLLPAFTGLPKNLPTCEKSFEEIASIYYKALKETIPTWRFDDCYFTQQPPQDEAEAMAIWTPMDVACKTSQWFIFAKNNALPEGFPWTLPANRIWVISATPPTGTVNWIKWFPNDAAFKPETASALSEIANCKGWMVNASFVDWMEIPTEEASLRESIAQTWRLLNASTRVTEAERESFQTLLKSLRQLLEMKQPTVDAQLAADLTQLDAWLLFAEKQIAFCRAEDLEAYQQWYLRHYGQKALPAELPLGPQQQTLPLDALRPLIQRYSL
jgi:hypothetical protein